jgi:hypothetical protein
LITLAHKSLSLHIPTEFGTPLRFFAVIFCLPLFQRLNV